MMFAAKNTQLFWASGFAQTARADITASCGMLKIVVRIDWDYEGGKI
jgi:hypothetical protein